MNNNKKIKFTFLIIAFISLSSIIGIIPSTFGLAANSTGVMTSYMHDDKKLIEDNFYRSKSFDEALIRPLVYWTSRSVIDENNSQLSAELVQQEKKSSRKQLDNIINIRYIVLNKNSQEIYTNTGYSTVEEFKNDVKGECDVEISSENYNISYQKTIDEKVYNKVNVSRNLGDVISTDLDNIEIYLSVPRNFENSGNYFDKLSDIKYNFDSEVLYFKIISILAIVSLIVFLVSIFIYKRMKCNLLESDSIYLKLYKAIPLEVYCIAIFICLLFLIANLQSYYYYDILWSFCVVFASTFALFAIIYILIKQLKSFDNKIEILKTSLIFRLAYLCKKTYKNIKNTTKSVPLAKRIILLTILGIILVGISWFMALVLYDIGFILGLGISVMTIIMFSYYIIKKLAYISYIMEGTERIKNGDIHYKLKLEDNDNFTVLAENINNIGEGLDKAIHNQLKSERMKSELITNVSHDLKTPLTSIINYVELIKKEENIQPEHIKDYVNVLDSKSKRLKALIEDLFEASKASSGNIELNMEKIDITQLLRQAIGEMEEKLSEANLDIKLKIPEEKIYIKADGKRLYRVLENLLINISKYSLNNTRVYIDVLEDDNKVKLIMKNISSYELNFDPEEIMERFKRADESRNTEGSGLGLAIARDLVNIQGGRFEIDIDGDLFKSSIEFNSID